MRKIILQEWISLDGFAVDANNGLGFFTSGELNKYSDDDVLQFMEGIDTILLGRKTYELFVEFWPTATNDVEVIADKLNSTPKLVLSNTLHAAPWGEWPAAKIISGDGVAEIKKLKALPGKNIVLWGSISLAQSLMKAGLIDEFHLRICPVIVGGGRLLFPTTESYINLKMTGFKKYDSGLLLLQYEPKPS